MGDVMSYKLEEMSAFFNARVETYNVVHPGHIDGGMESKNIISSFLPNNTKTIIDFGIGSGLELESIFRRFPNVEVTGLDISENMLQLLKRSYPNKKMNLFCVSFLDSDFGISRYDVALSVMAFHHYTHTVKTNLYRKIYNCIYPNGVYIESDYMITDQNNENAQRIEDFFFSEYKRLKEEQEITDSREYHYDTPCTVGNQVKMLLDAGFANVKEVWRRENTVILLAKR